MSVQRGGLNSLNSASARLFLFRYSQNYLINGQKNDILVLKYQFVASNLFKNQRFLNYKLSEFSVSILDVLILKTISMLIEGSAVVNIDYFWNLIQSIEFKTGYNCTEGMIPVSS